MVAAFHIFWAGWHRCKGFFPPNLLSSEREIGCKTMCFPIVNWVSLEPRDPHLRHGHRPIAGALHARYDAWGLLLSEDDQWSMINWQSTHCRPPSVPTKTAWWFQTFLIFTPNLGEMIPIWLYNIFQLGWFNHHLENSWMLLRWRGDMKFTNTLVLSVGPSSPCLRRVFWDSLESLETWVPRREPTAPTPDK